MSDLNRLGLTSMPDQGGGAGGDVWTLPFGMRVTTSSEGDVTVELPLRERLVDGWRSADRPIAALVAAVGDTAFAVACENAGDVPGALRFQATTFTTARPGDRLTASARRQAGGDGSASYEISVEHISQDGPRTAVAQLRGDGRRLTTSPEPTASCTLDTTGGVAGR